MKKIIALVVLMFISSQIIAASTNTSKNVKKCAISGQQYDKDGNALGKKLFHSGACSVMFDEPARSVSLSNPNKYKPLHDTADDNILTITVNKDGVAEIRGLTSHRITSLWEDDEEDESCWDITICVK